MAATTEPAAGVRQLSCQVNGEQVQLDLPNEDGLTLLDVLRDFLGITSPKNGCSPQAQCGCCTVLMDGKAVLSCALSPAKAEGKSITTLEGLDEEHRQQISESFVRCGGVQCGFCIPGMAMRGVGVVRQNAEPEPRRDRDCRSSRICVAARATHRSSTASTNTPSCAAANRCRPHRTLISRAASAPTCRATPDTTLYLAIASSSTTWSCRTCCTAPFVSPIIRGPKCFASIPLARWRSMASTAWSPRPTCRATATSDSLKKIGPSTSRSAKRHAAAATSSPALSLTPSGSLARRPS